MIFIALSKLNKIRIYFIALLITMISGRALALNEKQKGVLKQLTIEEYAELDKALEEKGLYGKAESYIDKVMSNVNKINRKHFFVNENREIAEKMGVKATDKTTKFGIPHTQLRTFNLVQAMIHYAKAEPIEQSIFLNSEQVTAVESNEAASAVIDYVNRWLSKRDEQQSTNDTNWVKLLYEPPGYNRRRTRIIKVKKNIDFDLQLINPFYHPDLQVHLLRNGSFHLTNVNIIREESLEDGDKIIHQDKKRNSPTLLTRNSASKAREIYIAVNRLKELLNNKYPDKFTLSIDDQNMFQVTLDFVAPYGWWEDAFFRIKFNFDNIDSGEPKIDVKYSPRVAHLTGKKLCVMQKNSARYEPEILSIEEQILNVINFMAADLDIKSEGILHYSTDEETQQNLITEEIINVNTEAQKANTLLYIETDHSKIEKSVHERLKDGEDPAFEYLLIDELDSESARTDIFIPVKMYNEAEIVEFDYTSFINFSGVINEARRKSGFKIPIDIEPTVYYKNKKLDSHNFQQTLYGIKKGDIKKKKKGEEENKNKKNHDTLTMIVKVPIYEKQPFENAIANSSGYYYVPENSHHLTPNEIVDESKSLKPIKWEIHLVENKKLAKANNMLYQYNLLLPSDTEKTTERYRGISQYGSLPNVWIPTVSNDMSEVEKKFALMCMYDLSRHKFKIPNNLKKYSVSNLGNDIITKALLTPKDDRWLPTQAYLFFLLQRVQMSLLIDHVDYSIAKENNVFFESVLNGNIDENVIKDLAFFLGHLTPSLRTVHKMDSQDKTEIIYRIVLNYLTELCVRTLMHDELNTGTGIVKQLIEKPEQFSLEDIYASNTKDIAVAFNVLQISDLLFTKIAFNPFQKETFDLTFYDYELEALQLDIKNMRNIIDGKKNLIPLFLNHLYPAAKYHSADLNFENKEFLDKFTSNVLKKYEDRTKNKKVKASLQAFLKNTEQTSDFFSKEKTDELVSSFRKKTPELLINVPNGKGGFRQTCYRCRKLYDTKTPIGGSSRTISRATVQSKEKRIKPLHKGCMKEDKLIRKQARELYKRMEKGYPKKQILKPDYVYNPVPDGFELIRINGDGNCMYSSIAEIFNRNEQSRQEGLWNQQTVRQMMHDNLRQIYSAIQNHSDQEKMMQELGLLSGIDADLIQAVLDNHVIAESASSGQSELGQLQQFGDAQLMTLLVPTQSVWFPVITQGDYGTYHEIYDLRRWVKLAPNLLAMLLNSGNYRFPDLTEHQRTKLLQLLLEQSFDQAELFVSQILRAPHQSSAYLIHYPSSAALLEHFDAAVSIEAAQNTEVDLSQTAEVDEALQDSNPLSLMILAGALLTTSNTPTSTM
ncbi:hypothetical protein [Endozoicomonas sp. 4G]|uniref:hypothetical protein n=1 Tax=Endozoicomonas sp. 4G TaxID=2872754 RepID=UPI00207863F7|nr:hypothetical protein [Endozoicomonas sp. 4G]